MSEESIYSNFNCHKCGRTHNHLEKHCYSEQYLKWLKNKIKQVETVLNNNANAVTVNNN